VESVPSEVERARENLQLARSTSDRLWEEYRAYKRPSDATQGVIGPEELRLLREASEWIDKRYAAEHALFAVEHGTPGVVGKEGEFQWLSMFDRNITDFLTHCPKSVLNKHLAITGIDGGTLRLTEQDKSEGWRTSADARVFKTFPGSDRQDGKDQLVAYSPRITSIHGLPNETHDECCEGHDEWYVFEQEAPLSDMEVFVNWEGFRLYDPEFKWWVDRLWLQMTHLDVESYISDGTVPD
jgi:hypothetical protein